MTELANARWELFAVLVARGKGTEADCYIQAGFKAATNGTARASASKLLAKSNIRDRVTELQAQFAESVKAGLAVTTTDVARRLWQLANYNVTDVFSIESTGKGRARRQRVLIKDTKDWPEELQRTCQGIKVAADGAIQVMLPIRAQPAVMVGKHLGMFQGEAAGDLPGNGLTYNDNRTMVYVDAPRTETAEEWQARVAKQRGLQIEGKVD